MTIPIKGFFLPTSRSFPSDFTELEPVLTKMYIDVAAQVNNRINGSFDKFENITGEKWFNDNDPLSKRQTYRQVYTFGAIAAGATLSAPHNIEGLVFFTRMFGVVTTDFGSPIPDWRPLPYASATDTLKNVSLKADDTDYTINNGANAPNIISGILVLEYLLN